MVNATGWAELFDGNMILASYVMYTDAMGSFFLTILYVLFIGLLYYKTRSPASIIIATTFLLGTFITTTFVDINVVFVMSTILVIAITALIVGLFKK